MQKTTTLKINQHTKNNITEIFGLAKSGKTHYLKELSKKGYNVELVNQSKLPPLEKAYYFSKYFLKHPINTISLFITLNSNYIIHPNLTSLDYFQIFRMRNSYLGAVLSKYEYLTSKNNQNTQNNTEKNNKKERYVDEFILQSLFMIFHKKTNKNQIQNIINKLQKSDKIIIIEESKTIRDKRFANRKHPTRILNPDFVKIWRENLEYNYKIIRKIIFNIYIPTHKSL